MRPQAKMNRRVMSGNLPDVVPKDYGRRTRRSRENTGISPGDFRLSDQVTFGRYRFEPATARLWAARREIRLTRKAAAVLSMLVSRAGEPVTKNELFATVWKNTVVGDDALVTCIQELRKALGDDAKKPRFIETRHRSGYRFVASVSQSTAPPKQTSGPAQRKLQRQGLASPHALASPSRAPSAESPAPPDFAFAPPLAASAHDIAAIAVLPFADMSPGRDQDHFCEGLAEELIDALTHVDGLRVVARTSSFQFRDGVDIRQAGRSLGVTALVEGSVRKSGDKLRITVQLIDVASGYHKWSQRFEREIGDVFAIQDEIAETVATTLRGGALSSRERNVVRRRHTATETYECFLRGRQYLHRMRRPDLEQSRHLFERAIALDAEYAPAWAGLATVHAQLFEWWGAHDEDLQQAERASRIAMELAPDLADAHVARGCTLALNGRYPEAQTNFEAAARIHPNLFDAYYYHARACFAQGEVERSAQLFRKAADVRREDCQSPSLLAQSLHMLGRHEEADAANRETVVRAERILALNPNDGRTLSMGSLALFEIGQKERALELSRRSLELYPDDMSALLNAGCLANRAGLKEEALDLLERAMSRGWGKRDWIDRDPDYDLVRDDPRFQRMLARLK